jgi:hypothetical protein
MGSDDLREALKKKGIEFRQHLILTKSQKPDVNGNSFAESVKSPFVTHVARIHVESQSTPWYSWLILRAPHLTASDGSTNYYQWLLL